MERIGRKYILDSSSLLANDDYVIFVEVFVCLVAVLPDKDALLIFLNLPSGGATPRVIVMFVVVLKVNL